MSVAEYQADAAEIARDIEEEGARVLLRHDPRSVSAATGALGSGTVVDYPVYAIVEGLAANAASGIQPGDVMLTIAATALAVRPTPASWTVYVGGLDPAATPVPGGAGVEQFKVVSCSDPIQPSGVSLLLKLHCRR